MPWDNSVNKNAVIYAVATTLDVRNMPLTGRVRIPGSIVWSRQTGIDRLSFAIFMAAYMSQQNTVTVCSERFDRAVVYNARLTSQFLYVVLHQYEAAVCNVIESFSHTVSQDYLIDIIEPVECFIFPIIIMR